MSWESKFINFGVLKVEGDKVNVYGDRTSYVTIYVSSPVTNATWAGGEIKVYLSNGKVQRYKDRTSYVTVY